MLAAVEDGFVERAGLRRERGTLSVVFVYIVSS